jgi:SAM-dependent methyltransferase
VTVHDAARGFDTAADAYERGRPEYPAAAVDRLVIALRLSPAAPLLDVGAGTGKLARFAAGKGTAVVAVDPAAGMLAKLAGAPRIVRLRAVAEALPLRNGAFGAAAIASAFHWFDGPTALRELHRVLRPGGRLALLWNQRDDRVGWVGALSAIVNRREGTAPRYRTGSWRSAFARAPGLFAPAEEGHWRHVHALSHEGVVDRVASISFVASLAASPREEVLQEVRALLAGHPDTAGRAEVGLAYATDLFVYERVE